MRLVPRRVKRLIRPPDDRSKIKGKPKSEHGRTPPETPAGWTLGPPDFIGIGVQKAGTTWWWKLLMQHPDMVSTIKETHQLTRPGWRPLFDADVERYHRYFPRREGSVVGEWTPRYMIVPAVIDAIEAAAPKAKIIVLLRDPVERYRSGVGQWQKRKELRGKRLNLWAGRKDAYTRSFYGFQLRRYVERLGRDQLLILQFEACKADPAAQYRRTLDFLGLPDWLPPEEVLGKPVNVARKRPSAKTLDEPPNMSEALEADVKLLLTLVPDLDLSLWPNFKHLASDADSSVEPG
jgi:hypothetical protein